MIRFENVTITYPGATEPIVREVSFTVPEGELCLVVGPTGSGKTTLLRAVNGLVPHFTGGTLAGAVVVNGKETRVHRPRDLADVVGVVGQDPLATFVTDTVEDELAYGMESLGLSPDVMRTRVEETLDLLGLADVRSRPIATLSGGQQQRVAIGAVLTMHPQVLVLDEPTSALDPGGAEDVLASLHRLVHDLGITVLLAEHRLERVVQYADRIVFVPGGGGALRVGVPEDVMAMSTIAPPVVQLGRIAGWSPLPLSIRDARRRASDLRVRLEATDLEARHSATFSTLLDGIGGTRSAREERCTVEARGLRVRYGSKRVAIRDVDFDVRPGEIVALMGRNGAGKSSLLKAFVGLVDAAAGSVRVAGIDPATSRPAQIVRAAGLVPQDPADLLYAQSVAAECQTADQDFGAKPGTCSGILERLAPGVPPERHPRDLSEGQRLALALAVILTGEPPLVLLDEPTRGLDYLAKARLVAMLRQLGADGHAIVFATHDVELVAELAERVVLLADGEIVADGPTAEVVTASPMFAPQVAKILRPVPLLTVGEVARTLEATP